MRNQTRHIKKMCAWGMSAAMTITLLPQVQLFAADLPDSGIYSVTPRESTSGTCGENLKWVIEDRTLTISGSGRMEAHPWSTSGYPFDKVVIENGVTSIGDNAFNTCWSLASIEIPNSVTSIGDNAFYWCDCLTNIEIPSSVTSIGDGAFKWCGLVSIEIPNGVTSIEESTFEGCNSLTSIKIPNSVTSIGDSAFYFCDDLTSIEIPNSVTSIGEMAFAGCEGLTSIEIPSSLTSLEYGMFWACKGLTSIKIPSSVKNIKDSAFQDCSSLVSIEISNGVTSIGGMAFAWCKSLTNFEIPDSVTSIGTNAFAGCKGLTSIRISSGLSNIEGDAFVYCSNLTSITVDKTNKIYDSRDNCNAIIKTKSNTLVLGCKNTIIPSNVTGIGETAFGGADGLKYIKIPSSVKSIENDIFLGCSGLTSIVVDRGNKIYDSRDNCNAIIETASNTLIVGCKNTIIPSGVTKIGDCAFLDCSGLTSIVIPSSVTRIGDCVFGGCRGLKTLSFLGDAPKMGEFVLNDVKATAYYPIGNATWTEAIRKNYGGSITWVAKKVSQTLTAKIAASSLIYGKTSKITASGKGKITYSSSNNSVATVSSGGVVTAKGAGTATITVKAAGDSNYNSATKTIKVTVQYATPSISSVSNTSGGVQIKWAKVSGAAKYRVYRKSGTGGWSKVGDTTGNSYTDKTAKSGTTYAYTVRCISSDGKTTTSGYNTTGKSIVRLSQPAPTLSNTGSGVKISWSKVTGATGYYVYRKSGNGSWTKIKTTSSTSYTDTAAKNGTTYYYTVKAYKGSSASSFVTTKKIVRLSTSSIGSATNSASKKMTVKWAKNASATGYEIKYVTGSTTKTVTVSGASTVSKVISGLTKGKTYKVYVRSYKTVSGTKYYSEWSSAKSVKISK